MSGELTRLAAAQRREENGSSLELRKRAEGRGHFAPSHWPPDILSHQKPVASLTGSARLQSRTSRDTLAAVVRRFRAKPDQNQKYSLLNVAAVWVGIQVRVGCARPPGQRRAIPTPPFKSGSVARLPYVIKGRNGVERPGKARSAYGGAGIAQASAGAFPGPVSRRP